MLRQEKEKGEMFLFPFGSESHYFKHFMVFVCFIFFTLEPVVPRRTQPVHIKDYILSWSELDSFKNTRAVHRVKGEVASEAFDNHLIQFVVCI